MFATMFTGQSSLFVCVFGPVIVVCVWIVGEKAVKKFNQWLFTDEDPEDW